MSEGRSLSTGLCVACTAFSCKAYTSCQRHEFQNTTRQWLRGANRRFAMSSPTAQVLMVGGQNIYELWNNIEQRARTKRQPYIFELV